MGQALPVAQQRTNQAMHHSRLRIEHVHSSIKRCRIVQDRIRLWWDGNRDRVLARCGALPHFRVRLTPWQPMGASGDTQLCIRLRWRSPSLLLQRCWTAYPIASCATTTFLLNPSPGRCPPWADRKSTSSCLRTLLASVSSCAASHPLLTATLWQRTRTAAADPPESLRTRERVPQRGLDRCQKIE
jgi:hypothetical protein